MRRWWKSLDWIDRWMIGSIIYLISAYGLAILLALAFEWMFL